PELPARTCAPIHRSPASPCSSHFGRAWPHLLILAPCACESQKELMLQSERCHVVPVGVWICEVIDRTLRKVRVCAGRALGRAPLQSHPTGVDNDVAGSNSTGKS